MSTFRFGTPQALRRELDSRVQLIVHPAGDTIPLYSKAALFLAWAGLAYGALVFGSDTTSEALFYAALLVPAILGIAFNIQHDGNHGAFSRRPWVNRLAGMTLDVIGVSSYFWKNNHIGSHHIFTNIPLRDTDIEVSSLVRLSQDHPWRWFHKYQHIYLWGAYAFVHLRYLYSDVQRMIAAKQANASVSFPRGLDLQLLIVGKAAFLTLAFVIPLTQHAWHHVLAIYVATSMVVGLVSGVVFQLAHSVDNVAHPVLHQGASKQDEWIVHQLSTTTNFGTTSAALTFLLGGLNYQVEHHLYRDTPHVRLPAIGRVVKEFCVEHGLPYHEHRSIGGALRSHYRFLRQMGAPPVPSTPTG